MIDTRREARHIEKEYGRYHTKVGESVIWFGFDTVNSQYSGTYEEGGRRYLPGLSVPVLWIDQIEASEQYMPEGRRPVQGLRFATSAKAMYEVGLSDREAHGHRVWDTGLLQGSWFNDRANDICYYNGRYYEISNYQIRGRLKGEDVIIGVTCTETYPEDEYNFDFPPTGLPIVPPTPVPPDPPVSPFAVIVIPDGNNPFLYSFGTNSDPGGEVHWSFGDGGFGTAPSEETIDYTYAAPGDYIVVATQQQDVGTADVTIEGGTPPAPDGYGLGAYGSGPYGDPS